MYEYCLYLNNMAPACRLQDAETKLFMAMFKDFWAGKTWELNAPGHAPSPAAQTPVQASFAIPNVTPADSSVGAGNCASMPKAHGAAQESRGKAAEARKLSQQGNGVAADVAADIVRGASTGAQDRAGACSFAQHFARHDLYSSVERVQL